MFHNNFHCINKQSRLSAGVYDPSTNQLPARGSIWVYINVDLCFFVVILSGNNNNKLIHETLLYCSPLMKVCSISLSDICEQHPDMDIHKVIVIIIYSGLPYIFIFCHLYALSKSLEEMIVRILDSALVLCVQMTKLFFCVFVDSFNMKLQTLK